MKEKTYMFDLMDTLVWSPNLMKLFASENAELLAKFKQDPRAWQRETARVADAYLSDGRIQLEIYPETRSALSRLRNDGKIAVLSNGTQPSINRILSQSGLDSLIDERLSLEQFNGRDKSDSELYADVSRHLSSKGLVIATYTDDKDRYCKAASASKVIPCVFQIVRAGEVKPCTDYKTIRSLEEVQ